MPTSSEIASHFPNLEEYQSRLRELLTLKDRVDEEISNLSDTIDWLNQVSELFNGKPVRVIASAIMFDVTALGSDVARVATGTKQNKSWSVVFRSQTEKITEVFSDKDQALSAAKMWVVR